MTAVDVAAARLNDAGARRTPCAPVRDLIGPSDVEAAYSVQLRVNACRIGAGAQVVGRKIGLTSVAVQRQLGVDQPDFGVLFDDMQVTHTAPMDRLLQPKVEAEIAFVLGDDLVGDITAETVRAAVDHAVVSLEIVDSRIADWDITVADTVADNASSGLFVLGAVQHPLSDFEPRDTAMQMYVDDELVSTGSGASCLGDPLEGLAWLARTARDLGDPLRAGQVILSGALGPMAPVQAGQRVRAELTTSDGRPLGTVSTRFVDDAGERLDHQESS